MLLGVLLLLVPENRNRQALLILIPFVLLSEIMWPWVAYFLAVLAVDTTKSVIRFNGCWWRGRPYGS